MCEDEQLDKLVDEIIEVKPWRGIIYGILYPLRRFPMFFYLTLPCFAAEVPVVALLLIAGGSLVSDTLCIPRYSKDMAPNHREFIKALCSNKYVYSGFDKLVANRFHKWIYSDVVILLMLFYACIAGVGVLSLGGNSPPNFEFDFDVKVGVFLAYVLPCVLALFSSMIKNVYFSPYPRFPNIDNNVGKENVNSTIFSGVKDKTGSVSQIPYMVDEVVFGFKSKSPFLYQNKYFVCVVIYPIYFLCILYFSRFIEGEIFLDAGFFVGFVLMFGIWTICSILLLTASIKYKGFSIIHYTPKP